MREILISIGSELKASEDGHIDGYLVLFGNADEADFDGDFFTAETDYDINFNDPHETKSTVYFHHGLDDLIGKKALGRKGHKGELKMDEVGIWIDAWLDLSDEYDQAVKRLIDRRSQQSGRKTTWSSGVPAHLVEREEVRPGAYHVKRWPLGKDASITPIKAAFAAIGQEFSELPIDRELEPTVKTIDVKTDGDDGADDSSNLISDHEVNQMSDQPQTAPQDTPQVQPVTLDAVRNEMKGLLEDFRKQLFTEPEPKAPIVNAPPVIQAKRVNIQTDPIGGGDDSDGMKAFYHYMRTGQVNSSLISDKAYEGLKALEGGTDSEGGYIVPSPQHTTIIERRDLASVIRVAPGFTMFRTTATTYDIPVEGDDSAAMDATAEEAAATQNDPVFGNVAGVISKYTRELRISDELLDDNDANLQEFIDSRVGREMAKAENTALDVELFANGTAALTLDSNSAIAASEIPEITGLIPASWEMGAIWNMRKSTGSLIRALQGNDFLFMPTPSARGGNGSRWELDDYPVFYNDQIAAMGADAQVISFYNPEAVGVIDRAGLTMLRDPYTLASTGQVKMIYKFRFDVIVLQAQAVLEIICPGA